jgi:UPF0042 nucleotide-binding protein
MTDSQNNAIIFVTGLSGGGMSSALKILEDLGFEVFDNFPLVLLEPLLAQENSHQRPIAIGIDSRTRNFDPGLLLSTMTELKSRAGLNVKTIFMTADEAVLLKRFTETRRTHPMARDRSVADGIAAEKSLLYKLKHESGYVIDTSDLSIHDLRRVIEGYTQGLLQGRLNLTVMSFAYRHGLPREADLVLDVRFLRNPNWVPELKEKTGRELDVQTYISGDESFSEFLGQTKKLLALLVPRYDEEGKNYLTIAFGCTGGKHRSVFMAEQIKKWLQEENYPAAIHHRELKGS